MNDLHKMAVRSLGRALTLGDEAAWATFTVTVYRVLDDRERAAMAFACLKSLPLEFAEIVYRGAVEPEADPLSTEAMRTAAAEYPATRDRRDA